MLKAALFVMLIATVAMGSGAEYEVASLQKLGNVVAYVAYDKPSPSPFPEERTLQISTELAMRRAGMQLGSKGDLNPNTPVFYVSIGWILREDRSYVFSVSAKLGQPATLDGNGAHVPVVTWYTSTYGYLGSEKVRTGISEAVTDAVNEFINDYLKANPGKGRE